MIDEELRVGPRAWLLNRLSGIPGLWRLMSYLWSQPRGPALPSGALRPVVALPTWSRWGVMQQRPQYLMAAFAAAGHVTYFVDTTVTRARQVDGVQVVPRLSAVPARHPILYVHFAPLQHLFDLFHDPVIVYDVYDDLSIFEADEVGTPEERTVAAHHDVVMERADLVLTSQPIIADRLRADQEKLLVIQNGVDLQGFTQRFPKPVDFPPATGLVLGYHGMLSYWFDFTLVESVAKSRPEWSVVLVGPIDPRAEDGVRSLASLSNVFLVDERPSASIPSYVQQFDVGIIPFQLDRMTEAVSPLKMYEYMASGVPVVATPLPACVGHPGVRTAADPEAFSRAIEEAAASREKSMGELGRYAEEASWDKRILPVLDWLDDHGLRRVP